MIVTIFATLFLGAPTTRASIRPIAVAPSLGQALVRVNNPGFFSVARCRGGRGAKDDANQMTGRCRARVIVADTPENRARFDQAFATRVTREIENATRRDVVGPTKRALVIGAGAGLATWFIVPRLAQRPVREYLGTAVTAGVFGGVASLLGDQLGKKSARDATEILATARARVITADGAPVFLIDDPAAFDVLSRLLDQALADVRDAKI